MPQCGGTGYFMRKESAMNKKRLFAFLTAVSVVLSSFAGVCGAEETTAEPVIEETAEAQESAEETADAAEEEVTEEAAEELREEFTADASALEMPVYSAAGDVSYTVDFDTVGFSVNQTQSGWKNTASDHQDTISAKTTDEGLTGKGYEISYSTAAAWYNGAIFINRPSNWRMSEDLKTITFNAKGAGKIKLGLVTESLPGGKQYEQTVTVNSPDDWTYIELDIADFKNGSASVNITDVVGLSLKSAEGTIQGDESTFKAYDGEAVLKAVKNGSIIIDDFTITSAAIAEPDVITYTADFDSINFGGGTSWSGWSRTDLGYSDYIKMEAAEGLEGNGWKFSYSNATYFGGEQFRYLPSNWKMSDKLKTIELDVKGTGILKMLLIVPDPAQEEPTLTNGYQYEYNIESSGDEWNHIIIPISSFKRGVSSITDKTSIYGVAFKGPGGPMSQEVFNAAALEDIEKVVKTGAVTIDNLTITSAGSDEPIIDDNANFADFDSNSLNLISTYSGWYRKDADGNPDKDADGNLVYNDYIKGSFAEGEGVEGSGFMVDYRQASYYAGRLFFSFPSNFNLVKGINQLEFDIKGLGEANEDGTFSQGAFNLYLMEGMRMENYSVNFDTEYSKKITFDKNNEWAHITLSIYDIVMNSGASPDITKVNGIAFTPPGGGLDQNALNTKTVEEILAKANAGTFIIDNVKFSSGGEDPDYSTGTFVADFDTVGFGSGGQKWSGWSKKDNEGKTVYNDYVDCKTANGIGVDGGKGFKITYRQATYYGGEQFIAKPVNWNMNYDFKCIEFDAKGKATFNFSLETGGVINGTRYGRKFKIDTTDAPNDGWQHFKIPLSEFTRTVEGAAVPIPVKGIVGFSITGPGGSLSQEQINAMEVEEILAKANIGEIVLDNLALTTDASNLSEPKPVTYKIDFDTTNFVGGDIFAGWSCTENGYSDFITPSTVSGVEGSAFRIDYQNATYFGGEVFRGLNTDWVMYDGLKAVEFDIKGKGTINMSLEEGAVVSGVRYGTRITADNEDEWTHVVIPIENFKNNGVPVTPSKIVGVSFSGIGGSVDKDKMKDFTKEELEAKANKGYVIIDNLAVTANEPEVNVVSSAVSSAGGAVEHMSDIIANEEVTASVTLSQAIDGIGSLTAGIYDKNGRLIKTASSAEINKDDNTISVSFTVADPANSYIKLMVWKSMYNCTPLENKECVKID